MVDKPENEAIAFLGRYMATERLQQEDLTTKFCNEFATEKQTLMVEILDVEIVKASK